MNGPALRDAAGKIALLPVGSIVGLGAAEALIRVTNGSRYHYARVIASWLSRGACA